MTPLRIASFDVFSGRAADGTMDADRFADAVTALDADLLGLQEVDRRQSRSHGVDLTALAAEATGAVAHRFVPALVGEPGTWTAATPGWDADAPAYDVGFVSRHPVTSWWALRWSRRWPCPAGRCASRPPTCCS